ncbi:hypothetical protein FJK98_03900 [Micromonospora sp. HM134]|uniref:DUF6069 family protein n=1 Tax=Micromonospora sp. HM134 TaxID=2583243 RepID=UPI0011982C0C|nr:DUF6069 family protein [Micromonospora sp. HM134]QDY06417.1 hypothetical protein FJK98_03900 [Micromonospora sp. HM134]
MALRNDVRDVGVGTRRRQRGLAVLGAVVAAVLVWAVGELVLGYDMVVKPEGQQALELGPGAIVSFSLVISLMGWALLALLERVTSRGLLIWTVVALVVLAVSLVPLFAVDASVGTRVTLAFVHLAVAAVLIPVFRLSSKQANP